MPMTHPLIDAAMRYRKAQALVIRAASEMVNFGAADLFVKLRAAVREMEDAEHEYHTQKKAVMEETGGRE